jgi:hypothetical protein
LVHKVSQRYWFKSYVKSADTKGIVGEIRLILSEDALTEITSITRTEAKWVDVHRIDEGIAHTFIYVTPLAAAILPRRGFPSDEAYDRTVALAKDCWERAHTLRG